MWVWRGLGYEHIAQLPGGALGALGCRCQEAPTEEASFNQEWTRTTFSSLRELSSVSKQESLLNENGEPIRLERPESAQRGTKAGSATGAWRLTKPEGHDLRLCVPGAVELEPCSSPQVEIISPAPPDSAGSGQPPKKTLTLFDALGHLSQQGGGEMWYRAPQLVCSLRSDIAEECCARRAPVEWPKCITGAQIGAAMKLTVTPEAIQRRMSRRMSNILSQDQVPKEAAPPASPMASQLLAAAPGSPRGVVKVVEVKCQGFRLAIAQHGGPPLNVTKLHELTREGVCKELQRWAEKALPSHPETWRTLNVIVKDGATDEESQAWLNPATGAPWASPQRVVNNGPGAAFRGGRQLGDMVLAAACEVEVAIEPFELSYGSAHVNSMRRMLEDEIATVLGVPALMVKCGDFSSQGTHGRPKRRHLPREAVTLEVALLCIEFAEIARGGPLLPPVAAMPLGGPRPTEAKPKPAKRAPAPSFLSGRGGRPHPAKLDTMNHHLRQTIKDTAALHESMTANSQKKQKAKEFEEQVKHGKGGKAGGLAKSLSDPGLGMSRGSLQASLIRTTATKNKDTSPDQLVKLLMGHLQDSSHPLRKHPDVFPMLGRIPHHGVHPGVIIVASRDSVVRDSVVLDNNPRMSAGSIQSMRSISMITESLTELLDRKAGVRSKERDVSEADAEALSKLSTRRLDILDMYAGRDGDLALQREQLIGSSEKELLDIMETAYPNHKYLQLILTMIGDRAKASQSCCLRLRHHKAIERLTHCMVRFNSDYSIVSPCFFIVESLMVLDLGSVDDALEKGVVPEFIAAIATFRRDQRMQRYGCRVLRRLYTRARETSLHGPRIVLLGKNLNEGHTFRGLECIFTAMHTFEDDQVIQLESLTLLAQLGELLYNNGMAERTFQSVEVVMRRHSQHADLMSEGVLIISRLGESFLKVQKRGIHTVAMAMARHRSNRRMQRVGTQALFNLSKNEDTLELCRAGGGIGAVLGAMCAHSRDTQTTQMGTRVLEKLAPRALARVFHACGDVASVLPPVSWSTDPLVASVATHFDLGNPNEEDWSFARSEDGLKLLETLRTEMAGSSPKNKASSKAASSQDGDPANQQPEGLASAAIYRRVGLAEDLDCNDVLWAVPGLPGSNVDGQPSHDILRRDMSALRESGCDERVLLAEGPTDTQLRELCTALQSGRDDGSLGPQDAELLAGLLGHFAWHSPDRAQQVVQFGGAAACASWLQVPDYVKQGHNPEDDHLVFPMFRSCLTALSCVCRHEDANNTRDVLGLDGIVASALEFADHLEKDVKRSAMRLLFRLMPYGNIPYDDVWRLILKHLESAEDESVRAAVGACAFQASTYGWDSGFPQPEPAPDLIQFDDALDHALEQALLGESPAALPILFTVEHLISKDSDTAAELIKQWIAGNLIAQLSAWLPRATAQNAAAADTAVSTLAARAIEKLVTKGARINREELEVLLRHSSSTEADRVIRASCAGAIANSVMAEDDAEMLAQVIACFVEEALPNGKRISPQGFDALSALADRVLRILKERDADLPAPDTLLQALERVEPHLEGVQEAIYVRVTLKDARNLVAIYCGEPDDSPGSRANTYGKGPTDPNGTGKQTSGQLPVLQGR